MEGQGEDSDSEKGSGRKRRSGRVCCLLRRLACCCCLLAWTYRGSGIFCHWLNGNGVTRGQFTWPPAGQSSTCSHVTGLSMTGDGLPCRGLPLIAATVAGISLP
ncbi:hypothetical protein BaRGS_00025340 [Batillaria attramentaria]|uniref:Uncharacterized protein n=1 Tax=Batillaria attramentaria TaxID=370345 RepID=A0ABD0K8J8_9CAEN